jgi:hypothetical protein
LAPRKALDIQSAIVGILVAALQSTGLIMLVDVATGVLGAATDSWFPMADFG